MAAKKKPIKKTSPKKGVSREIWIVTCLFAAVLLGIFCYLPSTGYLGDHVIKPFVLGLLGIGAYVLPPILLVLSIHALIKRNSAGYRVKYIFIALIPLTVGILANFIAFKSGKDIRIAEFYFYGMQNQGGGFLSALITVPMISVIGLIASVVLICAVIVVALMYTFDFSLSGMLQQIADIIRAKRASKSRAENRPVARSAHMKNQAEEFDRLQKSMQDPEIPPALLQEEAEPTIKIYGADVQKKTAEKKVPAPENESTLIVTGEQEYIDYKYPVLDLLTKNPAFGKGESTEDLKKNAKKLVDTLASFGVEVRVLNIERGPTVTRYELAPSTGVKVSKITNLADDIALNLAARGVRIEAPIPGKAAVGIEVPNQKVTTVFLRDVLDTDVFQNCASKVAFALGKDISGNTVLADIAKMPHLLIAGATGSGKSVCINTLITSILYKANPNEVKLLMIDPKMVELGVYNGIPHLLIPVVTDPKKAAGALNWAVAEMLNRYKLFADNNVRDLRGYNQIQLEQDEGGQPLPQILIIIDELADLMMACPHEVEDSICRLAQLARAAGMHLVIATQRPSVDVITGVIKANIPSRISFSVSSQIDSRTILDMAGAEKLLGKGDMLYFPIGEIKPIRLQGAFVTDKEVEKIVGYIRTNGEAAYDEEIIDKIESGTSGAPQKEMEDDCDALLNDAIELVVNNGEASVSLIQRKFKVGYARAARIVDQMEDRGIVSPPDGSKPRKVLISKMEYNEMLMSTSEMSSQSVEE